MKNVKNTVKEFIEVLWNALYTAVCFMAIVLYHFKDIIWICVLSWVMYDSAIDSEQKLQSVLYALFGIIICMYIRLFYSWYIKHRNTRYVEQRKRFTSLDKNGNPVVKIEDLPEIVDFLYRLEEGLLDEDTK